MKYKKSFKRIPIFGRKSIIGSILILAVLMTMWVAETLHAVRLPDGDHPVELYSTEMQDDLTLVMNKAINEAKSSITLVIYTLTDHRIINSLKSKSESGCVVKVICDSKTCPNIEMKLGPKVKILKRFFKGLMHIKMLIIDEKQTWIGSANMTRESLRHHGNLVAAIDSETFAEMGSAKVRSFSETERLHHIPHQTFEIGPQQVELWFLPDDPRAVSRIKQLIQGAQKNIRIAMFTWTRRDFANEVISAHKRGVNIEIVLDRSAANGAGEKIAKLLLAGGIDVKVSSGGPLLHHKCMIIDDTILVNGSANWTLAAFDKNDDCFVVIYPLLESQQKYLNGTWKVIRDDASPAVM
jgi:cardiolipin synthase A/B